MSSINRNKSVFAVNTSVADTSTHSNGKFDALSNGHNHGEIAHSTSNSKENSDMVCSSSSSSTPFKNSVSDINAKLRQQLRLLKMGKTEATLLGSKNNAKTVKTGSITTRRNTTAPTSTSQSLGLSNRNYSRYNSISNASSETSLRETSNEASPRHSTVQSSTPRGSGGFIDSLFNKLNSFKKQLIAPTIEMENRKRSAEEENESPTKSKLSRSGSTNITHPKSAENSTSSTEDFLGFSENASDITGLLPTPRVKRTNEKAVFVSDDLDTFMKENSLENVANLQISVAPKPNIDEALITSEAQPPNMMVPLRPDDMRRPRTLAEKTIDFAASKRLELFNH